MVNRSLDAILFNKRQGLFANHLNANNMYIVIVFYFSIGMVGFIQSTRKCITIYNNSQTYQQLFSTPYDCLTFQQL